jgi:hypothetical protein
VTAAFPGHYREPAVSLPAVWLADLAAPVTLVCSYDPRTGVWEGVSLPVALRCGLGTAVYALASPGSAAALHLRLGARALRRPPFGFTPSPFRSCCCCAPARDHR